MTDVLQTLFPSAANGAGISRELFVFKKHGQPFFFLPCEKNCAIQGLSLYPAQRAVARGAREFLRFAFRTGFPLFIEKSVVMISAENPFSAFLSSLTEEKGIPQLAILAGNPNATGRRFVLLVFSAAGNPCAVLKVGCGREAMGVIEKEEKFLASINQRCGIPKLRTTFQSDSMRAFSLDFVRGNSPSDTETEALGKILHEWIEPARLITADDVPAWSRLKEKCGVFPLFRVLQERLNSARFLAVIFHGDFAPWNIKVLENGSWIALDWERGESIGFPTWDWFHYRLQYWILVRRLTCDQLSDKIDDLLNSDSVLRYAQKTQTTSFLRELLLAYLFYSIEITQPAEGLQTTRDLLNVLSEKWQLV